MDDNKNKQDNNDSKLNNYSQVYSLDRLSDPDSETASTLIAGGDSSYINKDIDDTEKPKKKITHE